MIKADIDMDSVRCGNWSVRGLYVCVSWAEGCSCEDFQTSSGSCTGLSSLISCQLQEEPRAPLYTSGRSPTFLLVRSQTDDVVWSVWNKWLSIVTTTPTTSLTGTIFQGVIINLKASFTFLSCNVQVLSWTSSSTGKISAHHSLVIPFTAPPAVHCYLWSTHGRPAWGRVYTCVQMYVWKVTESKCREGGAVKVCPWAPKVQCTPDSGVFSL